MQVLEGIKVIDITQFIAGSRCTQILADMGAEVVHVESPEGDYLRLIFSLMGGAERNYSVLNRNKFGMAVNWHKEDGQKIMRDLIAEADIFVHNLIPGTPEKYNIAYEDIKKLNPNIIYISISGFGTDSIDPERGAFDIIAQATSGNLWNELDTMLPPSNYWADFMSGVYAANTALMALIHKMKTSQGQYIDVSMQDVLYFNNYRAMNNLAMEPILESVTEVLGRKPDEVMNSDDRMPYYSFFKSKDGKVAIVAMTPRQWRSLTEIIGRPGMADDEKFANFVAQVRNCHEAVALIEEWTLRHTSAEIVSILEKSKIPCGIAYTLDETNKDENLRHRGMFETVHHERFGDIDVPGIPYKFSKTPGKISMPAPGLGEHNHLILEKWLGLSADQIGMLVDKGIIVQKEE